MHFKPPEKPIKERRAGKIVLSVLLCLFLFVFAAAVSFVAFGGLESLPWFREPPVAYYASGDVRAMRLDAPEVTDEAGMRAYFAEGIAFAGENGFNTLIFKGKDGLSVWWRDKFFPVADGVDATDTKRYKADPLAILCGELEGKNIQLWLEVDAYGSGAISAESEAQVRDLALVQGEEAFSWDNEPYAELLAKSLGALPRTYPLAGIVLSGLENAGAPATTADFATSFHAFLEDVHTRLANTGRLVPLAAGFPHAGGNMTADMAYALQEEGYLTYALPEIPGGEGVFERVESYARFTKGLVLVQPDDDTGMLLFAAGQSLSVDGVLMADYPADAGSAGRFALLESALATPEGTPLPAGFDIPTLLAVNYPAQNARIATEELYIMGNSDPAQPLLLDGAEVESRASGGSFGVAVPLEVGDNSFTLSQGDKSITLNVERYVPEPSTPTYPADGTYEAKPGQVVRIAPQIASALTDRGDESSINETLQKGAVFVVAESATTIRNGKTTWAYRMPSGDWVMAYNCEWLSGQDGQAAFSGIAVSEGEGGEWLDFEGTGSPAAYVAYDDENHRLSLTFWDTALSLPEGLSSRHVTAAAVENLDTGAVNLTLNVQDVWGYSLEYTENGTRLFLKDTPRRSGDPSKPLSGIRIMLDAGHGGDDIGAAGIMGEGSGPNEKDVNLALAQSISYRLRQLGAEVIMIRDDDTFYELEARLAMQVEQKPDFFLAVHHNSINLDADRSEAMGVEAYYFHPYHTPPSSQFAQTLVEKVAADTGRTPRNEGKWGYYYVTRSTVSPSVLFEFGFMVSPYEFEDVASKEGMYTTAFAVGDAVLAVLPE